MKSPKAQILIIEDDQAILKGLSDVLVFNGYAVSGREDGEEGLSELLDNHYDLALVDVMLPSRDGLSICREARKVKPNQPLIILTAKGSEDDVINGFAAGADDYIAKPFSLRELIVRIEALLRRSGKQVGDEQISWRGITFDGQNLRACLGEGVVDLTRREMEIICYLHRHQQRIVSKKELLTEVWRYADADIETRTVDIHILKLRKKLQTLDEQTQLIMTVRGEGYRLADA